MITYHYRIKAETSGNLVSILQSSYATGRPAADLNVRMSKASSASWSSGNNGLIVLENSFRYSSFQNCGGAHPLASEDRSRPACGPYVARNPAGLLQITTDTCSPGPKGGYPARAKSSAAKWAPIPVVRITRTPVSSPSGPSRSRSVAHCAMSHFNPLQCPSPTSNTPMKSLSTMAYTLRGTAKRQSLVPPISVWRVPPIPAVTASATASGDTSGTRAGRFAGHLNFNNSCRSQVESPGAPDVVASAPSPIATILLLTAAYSKATRTALSAGRSESPDGMNWCRASQSSRPKSAALASAISTESSMLASATMTKVAPSSVAFSQGCVVPRPAARHHVSVSRAPSTLLMCGGNLANEPAATCSGVAKVLTRSTGRCTGTLQNTETGWVPRAKIPSRRRTARCPVSIMSTCGISW
eukprot:m.380872 g.380872  ORF g.380872 m.380872 type:complete len:413 (+) comp28243_c0_seq2:5754-6992(+)